MNLKPIACRVFGAAIVAALLSFLAAVPLSGSGGPGADVQDDGPKPVDDSMHHFMEYVFEPNYKRLKASMAKEPQDNNTWKAIKGDSLTLAEGTNLLLLRGPEENAKEWRRRSVVVRRFGGELYQAARKSDYAAARKAYVSMINSCNSCHNEFADGEYQLEY